MVLSEPTILQPRVQHTIYAFFKLHIGIEMRKGLKNEKEARIGPYLKNLFCLNFRKSVIILMLEGGAWIAEWYHTWLWSSVYCAMPWAVSLILGDDKLFFRPKHNIYAFFMILFGLFDLILLIVSKICHVNGPPRLLICHQRYPVLIQSSTTFLRAKHSTIENYDSSISNFPVIAIIPRVNREHSLY